MPIVQPAAALEGDRHDDGRLRPRHRGLAAACGARHRGGGHRRHWCARPSSPLPPGEQPDGVQVMQPSTVGHHAQADAPGGHRWVRQGGRGARLLSGGKTGTAEKVGKHGYERGFKENFNVSAFTSVFPMNAPRYAVYMMLDEPHGNKSTYGYSTAGWVAAPAAGRVIARIGADAGHAARHRRTRRRSIRRCPFRWSPAVRPVPSRAVQAVAEPT